MNLFNRIEGDKYLLALARHDKTDVYVFIFSNTSEDRAGVLKSMGRFASDPDLSFTWWDAAVLSNKVRAMTNPNV